jgi:hypothetical protein
MPLNALTSYPSTFIGTSLPKAIFVRKNVKSHKGEGEGMRNITKYHTLGRGWWSYKCRKSVRYYLNGPF